MINDKDSITIFIALADMLRNTQPVLYPDRPETSDHLLLARAYQWCIMRDELLESCHMINSNFQKDVWLCYISNAKYPLGTWAGRLVNEYV